MARSRTPQEEFWTSSFGNDYAARNRGEGLLASNLGLFADILTGAGAVHSVIEYGANIGMNLVALRRLLPAAEFAAVEINAGAVGRLRELGGVDVHHASMLEYEPSRKYDLVLTKGVLIHIDPAELARAYDLLHRTSARYICLAEYYNPTPVTVPYRGHEDRLFKRDFAGEMLDRYPDLELARYGFAYHRDQLFPQDDITWFLLAKRALAA